MTTELGRQGDVRGAMNKHRRHHQNEIAAAEDAQNDSSISR